jgi:hypothetical protein
VGTRASLGIKQLEREANRVEVKNEWSCISIHYIYLGVHSEKFNLVFLIYFMQVGSLL